MMCKKHTFWVRAAFCLLLVGFLGCPDGVRAHAVHTSSKDSLHFQSEMWSESFDGLARGKMAHSAFPIQVKVQGRALCVRSNYNQVLPVYTQSGSLHSLIRLNKGVNWLNGLPRGIYYINHRKILIP